MGDKVHVEEAALTELKNVLSGAGEGYKEVLKRLNDVINQIIEGDFQGTPADDFRTKYEAKKADLFALAEEIDKAEEFAGVKHTKFGDMISGLGSDMK